MLLKLVIIYLGILLGASSLCLCLSLLFSLSVSVCLSRFPPHPTLHVQSMKCCQFMSSQSTDRDWIKDLFYSFLFFFRFFSSSFLYYFIFLLKILLLGCASCSHHPAPNPNLPALASI